MSRSIRIAWAALFLTLAMSFPAAAAARRVALLIGNGAYANFAKLLSPGADVATLKQAFEGAGFDKVETALDLGREALVDRLRAFEASVAEADIAAIYFSGHGMTRKGVTYLVPVDARLAAGDSVAAQAISVEQLLGTLAKAKKLRLVLVDASRDDPGLARAGAAASAADFPAVAGGTVLFYSTKPGALVAEGDGEGTPFARALARRLFEPGVELASAARNVRDDVLRETGNRQQPFYAATLGEKIYLGKP